MNEWREVLQAYILRIINLEEEIGVAKICHMQEEKQAYSAMSQSDQMVDEIHFNWNGVQIIQAKKKSEGAEHGVVLSRFVIDNRGVF